MTDTATARHFDAETWERLRTGSIQMWLIRPFLRHQFYEAYGTADDYSAIAGVIDRAMEAVGADASFCEEVVGKSVALDDVGLSREAQETLDGLRTAWSRKVPDEAGDHDGDWLLAHQALFIELAIQVAMAGHFTHPDAAQISRLGQLLA